MKNMNKVNLGWLAGILDGEGSLGIQRGMPKYIDFYNTNILVIKKIIKILEDNRISYKYSERQIRGIGDKKNKMLTVRVSRIKHMKSLLKILLSHLTCKRDKAIQMLKYKPKRKTTGLPSLSINEVFNTIKNFDIISPKELAIILDTNSNRTRAQLLRMEKLGLVKRQSFGIYKVIR